MHRSRTASLVRRACGGCVAAALLLGALARADVDVEVRNGDRIAGTLLTTAEVETFRYEVPSGAVLSVTAKGKKRKGAATPVVNFRILDPAAAEAVPFQPVPGTTTKLRGFTTTSSGSWSVEVAGATALPGDYSFTASWKSPAKVPLAGVLPAGGMIEIAVPLDAGASARFELRAAPGSGVLPRIVEIRDESGAFRFPFAAPAAGATSHATPKVKLPVGGDLVLVVEDAGAAGGAIAGTATVKPPKPKPRAIALTTKQIGDGGAGGASATGAVIDAAGGSVLFDDDALPVDGAAVSIPAGALSVPTAILVGTSPDLPPPQDLDAAGPAVFFGPDGTKFADGAPATVTIPIDLVALGGDTSAVRIFTRDAKGKVKEVLPATSYVFDTLAGTVSFPAAHFSSFQAFATTPARTRSDLDGDGFDDLVIPARFAGASGEGRVYVFRGGTSLPTSGTSASADVVLSGVNAGDELGQALAAADINGDGIHDLIAGVRGGTRRVVVWFGGANFLLGGPPDLTISPAATDPNLGIQVAGGDLDDDGVGDLVIGDESNSRGVANAGGCFVFFGPVTTDRNADSADVILTGELTGDLFGANVQAGNVIATTGDGDSSDLVVAADQADTVPAAEGRVYVFRGPLAAGTRSASTAHAILVGSAAGEGFGLPFALGDVDGGGMEDIVAAGPGADTGPLTDPGRVVVFRGEAGIGTPAGDTPFAILTGRFDVDRLGSSLVVGNFTGAGIDVGAGAPGDDGASTDLGSVAFWDGITTGVTNAAPGFLPRVYGPAAGHVLGSELVYVANVNADGLDDLIVGNPADPTNGTDAGACYVYFGRTSGFPPATPDVIIFGAAGERLGTVED